MDWAGCANSYAAHILASKAPSILREQKLLKENYRSLVSSAWTLFFYTIVIQPVIPSYSQGNGV